MLDGRDRQGGADLWGGYSECLAAGGYRAPTELRGNLGVDLEDPAAWEPGFREMELMVEAAEAG